MNRYTDRHMDRRVFLKTTACVAGAWMLPRGATARRLVLVGVGSSEKISRIEWLPYDTGQRGPDEQNQQRCAVRLTTTGGAQGWADLAITTLPDADAATLVSDTLLAQDPASHDNLWRKLYQQGLALGTLAAVDVALWDLRGRMAGEPVHALLGTRRQQVKTCLNTGFNLGEPADYAHHAQQCQSSGVGAIKVQPYIEWDAGFPDKDMAAYSAVREAVGADYPCMADNQSSYTYDEALRVGRRLDDLRFAWYESPMPETDAWVDRYVALAAALRTPICGPETHPDAYAPRVAWIAQKACDVCRISLYHGGFSACLQLASACEEAGVALTLHDVGPDAYPYLQLMGATSESLVRYFEIASLFREHRTLPGRSTPEPVFDSEGHVTVPQTPGMGVELDWRYIVKHRTS